MSKQTPSVRAMAAASKFMTYEVDRSFSAGGTLSILNAEGNPDISVACYELRSQAAFERLASLIDAAGSEAVAEERRTNADAVFSLGAAHAADTFRRDLAARIYVAYLADTSAERALEYCFRRADEFIAKLAKTKGEA